MRREIVLNDWGGLGKGIVSHSNQTRNRNVEVPVRLQSSSLNGDQVA